MNYVGNSFSRKVGPNTDLLLDPPCIQFASRFYIKRVLELWMLKISCLCHNPEINHSYPCFCRETMSISMNLFNSIPNTHKPRPKLPLSIERALHSKQQANPNKMSDKTKPILLSKESISMKQFNHHVRHRRCMILHFSSTTISTFSRAHESRCGSREERLNQVQIGRASKH